MALRFAEASETEADVDIFRCQYVADNAGVKIIHAAVFIETAEVVGDAGVITALLTRGALAIVSAVWRRAAAVLVTAVESAADAIAVQVRQRATLVVNVTEAITADVVAEQIRWARIGRRGGRRRCGGRRRFAVSYRGTDANAGRPETTAAAAIGVGNAASRFKHALWLADARFTDVLAANLIDATLAVARACR